MTDIELFGVSGPHSVAWTATPKGLLDRSLMLTVAPDVDGSYGTALLTVRGKDHELNAEQLMALARAATFAAARLRGLG